MARVGAVPDDPSSRALPRNGDVIAGKYRVERVLGSGGMGVVLAVTHLQLGEAYAIKCLNPAGAADPETVERFMREARAAVRIKSEHIARVSDVGTLDDGSPYILMECLSGRDLGEVLAASGRLSIDDAVEYVLQACTGIAEAHALGIVHRDLKPSNLFLTERLDGAALVKVLDFGISKAVADTGPHTPSLTQTASVFGSPAYMSPEQIRSAKNVDFRTDVWSLGVILHELLTGELPFVAETSGGLLSAIAADEPEALRDRRPDAGEELDAIVKRCLEKKVEKRFQSVAELASALEPFRRTGSLVSVGRIRRLSGGPPQRNASLVVTPPPSDKNLGAVDVGAATDKAWTTGTQAPKTSRALILLAAASLLVIVAVGSVYAMRRSAPSTSAPAPIARGIAEPATPASGAAPVDLAPAPSTSAIAVATAPTTAASAGARPSSARPGRGNAASQPAVRVTPSASIAIPTATAPAAPTSAATPTPKLDGPTDNSH
ncbi:MAG: eukaryotic-like serine/threonine-protein kinase [Myxococcales bacterium]|nr:eukaryotic-like serine/threonine-protein kinase [Myxococcales bacterium]